MQHCVDGLPTCRHCSWVVPDEAGAGNGMPPSDPVTAPTATSSALVSEDIADRSGTEPEPALPLAPTAEAEAVADLYPHVLTPLRALASAGDWKALAQNQTV